MAPAIHRTITLGLVAALSAACDSNEDNSSANSGGNSAVSATGGATTTTTAVGGSGTRPASSSGGMPTSSGGVASSGKSCNTANVTCRIAVPSCEAMQVPELNASGTCYTGNCIPIGECACSIASDCPDNDQYTCRNDIKRCTPYL